MRKAILAVALWALAAVPLPALAQSTLRMVAHADLKILDPIWTTANITRNHGYMVYDTLFATDADFKIQPQMAEKDEVSADKLTWTFTLRDGLEWHDGKPVTAEDCVASIRRWGARDGFGQLLMRATAELKPSMPRRFVLVLKEPFGLVLEALGKVGSQRAVHDAQARRRDRSQQADRRLPPAPARSSSGRTNGRRARRSSMSAIRSTSRAPSRPR